ncbi:macrolide phosphotransferase [Algoriphagus sp. 4150]|uniref:Mph(E)/Mph(G) family macrolide 2'-phosphotransferase n=1 Tax=Algoriphagus sp. 4150 TaxID=2817756 RepID=UPI0028625848|nr:Mph(E)/Mph(G) family macrolide 2'-phosphotransferase [Algoriphagus sp. 4150]MDR7129489.1 macrolide phosphotransferase [Algoriphagus sp. 4150]
MTIRDIQKIAEEHGLLLTDEMKFNEMGIDFKVGFATDKDEKQWVLRIPRRNDLGGQIEKEKRILELVKKHLSIQVPDWQIATPALVAYPLLKDKPALTFDAITYEVTWNMNQESLNYVPSLAKTLLELHRIGEKEVEESGLKVMVPGDLRSEIADRLQLVKSELGISTELETRYRKWLDNDGLWPDFTGFIHGDLYAGHVLTSWEGVVSGIIDWSTAHVSDISQDFSGHVTVFGEDSLKALITEYEKQGGKVWDKLYEQTLERAAAAPLAYGFFAVETQDETHIQGAKAQLGVGL